MKFIHGFLRNTDIKSKLIKYFCISIIIPLLLSNIINYLFLSTNQIRSGIDIYTQIIMQTNENLDSLINSINTVVLGISFNADLQDILYNKRFEDLERDYTIYKVMDSVFGSYRLLYNLIGNIVIFSDDGKLINSLDGYQQNVNIKDYEWYASVKDSQGENVWIGTHIDLRDISNSRKEVIAVAKKIRRLGDSVSRDLGKGIGYILINIRENAVNEILSKVHYGDSGHMFIVDEQSRIVSHRDKSLIGQYWDSGNPSLLDNKNGNFFTTVNRRTALVNFCTSGMTGWKLIGVIDRDEIIRNSNVLFFTSISFSIGLFILFVLISIPFSNSISKPIGELRGYMKEVEKGKLDQNIRESYRFDELNDLVNGFNTMVSKLNNSINEVYNARLKEKELEISVRQAELSALQQQINPHFLYNALDSINWMAQLDDNQEISNMVTALGDFFRTCINKGLNFVSIEEEIQNVKYYIYIQQIRYSSKLEVIMDIDERTYGYMTMKLLLQPLVENAIVHGIEPKITKGKIVIKIEKLNEVIRFIVWDDGVGITQAAIDEMLNPAYRERRKGIGLINVMDRLRLYFNDRYAFHISSEPGSGTEVVVTIPCFTREDEILARHTHENI